MKKKIINLLYLFFVITLAGIGAITLFPYQQVQASVNSEALANTYLNVTSQYLYLGVTGKDTFDFDIKANALIKKAKYSWYIKQGKGNPEAISIDSKTGVVTAKSIGTAYIRCKITLADQTILRPEAKVEIRNNITGVEITNSVSGSSLIVGSKIDFDYNILNSAAGKDVKTSGIVRWEIKDDTAKAGQVTEDGVVTPTSAGEFSIRAICFESTEDYKLWLSNKEKYANYITGSSDYITIKVLSSEGTATTQKELNELLASKSITQITISSGNKPLYLTLSEGNYSDKTLIINGPNTSISNYAVFKQIKFQSTSGSVWKEYALDNSFILYDSDISLIIAEQSSVKTIEFQTKDEDSNSSKIYNNVLINVNGNINKLDVTATSTIAIAGKGSINFVNIAGLDKTSITTSIKLLLVSCSDFTFSLFKGSEGSIINIYGDATAEINNLSSSTLSIYHNGGYTDLSTGYNIIMTAEGKTISLTPAVIANEIKQTPTVASSVFTPYIKAGSTLGSSNLYGTFQFGSTEVIGSLSWTEPTLAVSASGYYKWTFTPVDILHYNIVTGEVYVLVK